MVRLPEETLQLPPRDTERSKAEAAKLETQIEQGRALREEAVRERDGESADDDSLHSV